MRRSTRSVAGCCPDVSGGVFGRRTCDYDLTAFPAADPALPFGKGLRCLRLPDEGLQFAFNIGRCQTGQFCDALQQVHGGDHPAAQTIEGLV